MVAGEASGDLLASLLLPALKTRWPALRASGIGGPRMAAQGFEAWWPHDRLAVHGYRRRAARTARAAGASAASWVQRLLRERPAAFIGVDAPDFNLGLEARLKARGHQDRALRLPVDLGLARRAHQAASRAASTTCCACFRSSPHLLQARHRGHLCRPPAGRRDSAGPAAARGARGARPGRSRRRRRAAAGQPRRRAARHRAGLPAGRRADATAPARRCASCCRLAAGAAADAVERLLREHAPELPVQLLDGRSHEALAACDVTLIASGTATLEAALFKRPMVIAYRVALAQWQLMKRMRYQPWVGPAQHPVPASSWCPSCCRTTATPEALADAVLRSAGRRGRAPNALAARFTETAPQLRRDTAQLRHRCDRARFLKPEQLGAALARPRPDGRRRRGRPRPAGRAGGGRGGDPRRAAADARPGRFQDAVARAGASGCSTRSAPRRCAAASPRPASRRSTSSTSCRPRCWRCAVRWRACA